MTLENILKLLDAGYTKAEIAEMTAPKEEPKPKQEEPAPKEAPKQEPKQDAPKYLTADDLVKVIQAMNIQNAQRDEKPIETAEDIIASVIMPTKKGK